VHGVRVDERVQLTGPRGPEGGQERAEPAVEGAGRAGRRRRPGVAGGWEAVRPGALRVRFRRLDPGVPLPAPAHPGDAGLDLRSRVDVEVGPGERAMVPTGLAVAIPPGHAGLVLPRSGLASREGLTLANAPGLIDAGYRGEVVCAVVNLDRERAVRIARGDRIAQLVVVAVPAVAPEWAEELPPSERGEGGFGSTGR
jgi:dUTP pyrophosphatase